MANTNIILIQNSQQSIPGHRELQLAERDQLSASRAFVHSNDITSMYFTSFSEVCGDFTRKKITFFGLLQLKHLTERGGGMGHF